MSFHYSFTTQLSVIYMHEKANCVSFIYMQSQKVKFKSVQINMKQSKKVGKDQESIRSSTTSDQGYRMGK